MTHPSRYRLLIGAGILLALVLGLGALFDYLALYKLYEKTALGAYRQVGKMLQANLATGSDNAQAASGTQASDRVLRAAKFAIIDALKRPEEAQPAHASVVTEADIALLLAQAEGMIVSSSNTELIGTLLPKELVLGEGTHKQWSGEEYRKSGQHYYLRFALDGAGRANPRHLWMRIDAQIVAPLITSAVQANIVKTVLLLIIGLGGLITVTARLLLGNVNGQGPSNARLGIAVFCALALVQALALGSSIIDAKVDCQYIAQASAGLPSALAAANGLPGTALAHAADRPSRDAEIATHAVGDAVEDQLWQVAAGALTVIVIALLVFGELLILASQVVEKATLGVRQSAPIHFSLARPVIFLLLFGIDIPVAFMPMHAERLYTPLFGLAKPIVMGLPISMEFLCAGAAILGAGFWLDRRGWHEPFVIGLALAIGGGLYSWLAPDVLHFIVSRAVVGFGYGLALMAAQGFVIAHTVNNRKAQGLAHLFAGVYAGSLCGGATGAMLADFVGYETVFLIGVWLLIGAVACAWLFMRPALVQSRTATTARAIVGSKPKGRFVNFLLNRNVIGLIFFSSLPASIAVVGFINYFSPVYLSRMGASQSAIGQIMMIYGLCMIYLGPWVSRFVDASHNKKRYIFFGCVLGSCAFLTFNVLNGLLAAAVAVFLLGLSSSFILSSQSAYALNLRVTQDLGEGKAIGIFRSTGRVGQMLGPMIFGGLAASGNIGESVAHIGAIYLLTALLFLLLTDKDDKRVLPEGAI